MYLPFTGWRITSSAGLPDCAVHAINWCGIGDLLERFIAHDQAVLQSHLIATDDTHMPMQQSRGPATGLRPWVKISGPRYMWVYIGDDEHPYNIYDFSTSRNREVRSTSWRLRSGAVGRWLCRTTAWSPQRARACRMLAALEKKVC